MKILVTGGAGFIGSHVVDRLIAEGHEPIVIDNLVHGKRSYLPAGTPFIFGDIVERELVNDVMRSGFDAIMHLAAQKSVVGSMADPLHDAQVNITGTLNLLMAAAENGVSRFMFAATGGALYGETDNRPTPEDHPAIPESPYGISKLTGERYIMHFAHRFNMVAGILRLANVYGPRQDHAGEGGVVSIFCSRAKKGESVCVFGDGGQTRDYVYVGDVAEAFVAGLSIPESVTVNIGTSRETSVNELIEGVERVSGKTMQRDEQAARAGEIRHSCLGIGKAATSLGWSPKTSLDQGLELTLQSL